MKHTHKCWIINFYIKRSFEDKYDFYKDVTKNKLEDTIYLTEFLNLERILKIKG